MTQRARGHRALLAAAAGAALLIHSIVLAAPPPGKGPGKDTGSAAMPPAVTITLPTSEPGTTTTAAVVAIEAQVKSNSTLVSVTWRSDRGPSGSANPDRGNHWAAGEVPLADGVNVLSVTATDVNGLSGSASVGVTRTQQATQPPPSPPDARAPVIQSARAYEDRIELAWTQSGDAPDGGYSVSADSQAGVLQQTIATYATLTGLDTSMGHCLTVTAHYEALGQALSSPPSCTDPVTPANTAPVISGAPPASVEAGQAYLFQPEASDADGDAVGFSIVNQPVWAGFDPVTGHLAGTPSGSQTGRYAGIEIAASDGLATTALPAFDIEVMAPPGVSGTASLSWMPPTQREDGSPLTDLAGYRIYYGRAGGVLDRVVVVDNPGLTTWVVEGLAEGDWAFAVSALDGAGHESDRSNEAFKTVGGG